MYGCCIGTAKCKALLSFVIYKCSWGNRELFNDPVSCVGVT